MDQRPKSSVFINISIVVTVVILFCLAGEFFARMYVPPNIRMTREAYSYFNMMDYDEAIGGRVLKKNYDGKVFFRFGNDFTVKTNSMGLRSPEFSLDKGDSLRILFVGDSFTMGYGVEQGEAFPDNVRQLFSKNVHGKPIDVVNGGITGWGTLQIKNFLTMNFSKINPDTVIYALYLNDVYDTYRNTTHSSRDVFLENWRRQKKDIEEYMAQRSLVHAAHFFLTNLSYFYEFMSDRIQVTLDKWESSRLASNHWLSVGRVGVHNYNPWSAGPEGTSVMDHSKVVKQSMAIHSWKIRSLADRDELALLIWRLDEADGRWKVIGKSKSHSASFGINSIAINPPLQAKKGDRIGFFTKAGSIARLHPLDNMARSYRDAQPEDKKVELITDGDGNYCMRVDGPPIDAGPTEVPLSKAVEQQAPVEVANSNEKIPKIDDEADISKGDLEVLKPRYNQTTRLAYEQMLGLISEMKKFVESKGANFYVVNIPSFEEVGKNLDGDDQTTSSSMPTAVGGLSFDERLLADLASLRVNFISIKGAVKSAPERALYLRDSHLNKRGHQVVGRAIYEAFQPKIADILSKK